MPTTFLDDHVYYKPEIDTINAVETARVNGELDSKSDKSTEGSPQGLATLDVNGDVNPEQLPFASNAEALTGVSTVQTMSPVTVKYVVDVTSIPLSQKGANEGVPPLDINGKIPSVYIPDSGTVQSFYVETQAEMLALTLVYASDRCIVYNDPTPENNNEFIAIQDGPTLIEHWGPVPSHNAVTSVNGLVGIVNLTSVQIPEIATNTADIATHKVITDQNTARSITNEADIAANDIIVTSHTSTLATHTGQITDLISPDSIKFVPQSPLLPHDEGQIQYNSDRGTFEADGPNGNRLSIGHNMHIHVTNRSGIDIPAGRAVRVDGVSVDGVVQVALAQANTFETSLVFGFTEKIILNNGLGAVVTEGEVHDLDTAHLVPGVPAYLSATNPGELTNTAPDIASQVGGVLVSDTVIGEIRVLLANHVNLPKVLAYMNQGAGLSTIGATYQDIIGYTTHGNVFMTYNETSGIITIPSTGIYNVTANIGLLFDSVGNHEETLNLRIIGSISGTVDVPLAIPRNSGAVSAYPKLAFSAITGETIKLQLGGATKTLTNVSYPLVGFEVDSKHIR